MATDNTTETAIALNRFGLGARPDEVAPTDARRWLLDQLGRYTPQPPRWAAQPGSASLLADSLAAQRMQRMQPDGDEMARRQARQAVRREARDDYLEAVRARLDTALTTSTPFVERLVHFWANHFALSVDKAAIIGIAGAFEAEAIRPHVLGRFEDLLMAAERHPAMLLYLDQARSVGPGSPAAMRANASPNAQRQRGLNENLAREILELHTLGVRSGYTQDDVTEFARALTGWGIAGQQASAATRRPRDRQQADAAPPSPPAAPGTFEFHPALHEPGERVMQGRRYPAGGEAQGTAILRDLAASPATARHVSTKLARHFAGDTPPPALVARLEGAWLRTRGDLSALYRVLVESPEVWAPGVAKFKTPWEWLLSSLRALGRRDTRGMQPAQLMNQLGQPVWRPGSPAGWDDLAASWAAPDALVRRVEFAQRLAGSAGAVDARALAPQVLPGALSAATAQAIARSESPASGLALLLVSPEFLRR